MVIDKVLRKAEHAGCTHFASYQTTNVALDMEKLHSQTVTMKQGISVNEFNYFERIINYLQNCNRCEVRPLKDLMLPISNDKYALSLRHDLDMDLFTAIPMSKALFLSGLSATFYVLHTNFYYGEVIDDRFVRNENVLNPLIQIQNDYHCEVGLHTDGLWVYQQWGLDGAQAVREELTWLREHGLNITGTVAHNSAPMYGAENFELFEGRAIFNRFVLERNEQRIPLQSLSEVELGLTYEANYPEVENTQYSLPLVRYLNRSPPADAVRDEAWMRTYLLDNPHWRSGHDYNLWLLGADRWAIAGHPIHNPLFIWNACLKDIFNFLDEVLKGKHIVCNIHPVYILVP